MSQMRVHRRLEIKDEVKTYLFIAIFIALVVIFIYRYKLGHHTIDPLWLPFSPFILIFTATITIIMALNYLFDFIEIRIYPDVQRKAKFAGGSSRAPGWRQSSCS